MNTKISSVLIACTLMIAVPAAFAQDAAAPAEPTPEQGRAPQAAKKKHKHKHRKGHHGKHKSQH